MKEYIELNVCLLFGEFDIGSIELIKSEIITFMITLKRTDNRNFNII